MAQVVHCSCRRRFLKQVAACGLAVAFPGVSLSGESRRFFRLRLKLEEDFGAPDPISFGLVADTHFGDLADTDRPRYFRASEENLEESVGVFNQAELSFAVHLGDVIQESGSRPMSLSWLGDMDRVFREFDGPIHYVMGNHDLGNLSKADFLAATSGTFKAPHYFFDRGGYRFVVLDPNFRQDGVPYDRGNFNWTDAFVPSEQVEWMKNTLEDAANSRLPVVVFSHQCLDGVSPNHMISNASELRRLFEESGNVVAVFYGHRHAGGYFNINGIHYIGVVATVNGPDKAAALVKFPGNGVMEIVGLGERQPNWGPMNLNLSFR